MNGSMNLSLDSKVTSHGVLSYGLYKLCLFPIEIYSISYSVKNVIAKRPLPKEKPSVLWHKKLSHICRKRVERLIKDSIFPTLNFTDLETCVACCTGKLAKIKKKVSNHSSDLLKIIHTDLSGPDSPIICNNIFFITFIDNFSQYG